MQRGGSPGILWPPEYNAAEVVAAAARGPDWPSAAALGAGRMASSPGSGAPWPPLLSQPRLESQEDAAKALAAKRGVEWQGAAAAGDATMERDPDSLVFRRCSPATTVSPAGVGGARARGAPTRAEQAAPLAPACKPAHLAARPPPRPPPPHRTSEFQPFARLLGHRLPLSLAQVGHGHLELVGSLSGCHRSTSVAVQISNIASSSPAFSMTHSGFTSSSVR